MAEKAKITHEEISYTQIFKAIVGSRAYGTNTPESDTDYKGVYVQNPLEILSSKYLPQFKLSNDESYYEIMRFLEVIQEANPTFLELLYSPEECIVEKHPAFDIILAHKEAFLTKKCLESFAGYAADQIRKAKGLDKKMNWERSRIERKTPADFCYAHTEGKTVALEKFLAEIGIKPEECGLAALDHFKDCYALYKDTGHGYRGLMFDKADALHLSNIPKGETPVTIISYNKDGYSLHCKEYHSYRDWLRNRNTQRYVDVQGHNQKIDGKNLMHCRRLLDVALEIARDKTIRVKRPNASELLRIRKGEVDLNTIIDKAVEDMKSLTDEYAKSDLPETVDPEFCRKLLLEVRQYKL